MPIDHDDDGERTIITSVVETPKVAEGSDGLLVVLAGPAIGRTYELTQDISSIGRSGHVDVIIPDPGISRKHSEIIRKGGEFWIRDLGSMNGTHVNGEQIGKDTWRIKDGARIQLGSQSIVKFSLMDSLEAEAQRRLSEAIYSDALTGVHNRRYLDSRLREEAAYAQRHGRPIGILLIDIDHFKQVNDRHGHPVGDEVLRTLAQMMARNLRREDVIARYGGEEFVIIARGINLAQSVQFAERIRAVVASQPIPTEAGPLQVTVSIGVAAFGPARFDESMDEVVRRSDAALYDAKETGRNRVCARALDT